MTFQLPEYVVPDTITYQLSPQFNLQHLSSDEIVRTALDHPYASLPLIELAKGKKDAVILISDQTRVCPSYLFLETLLNELNKAGIQDRRIQIIVSLGLHRKHSQQELSDLAGSVVFSRVKVTNHSALSEDCVYVGTTKQGTEVEINGTAVEADLLIATGNINPHGLVGMSGGVKALFPGTGSGRSIEQNHSLSQKYTPAVPGKITNEIHKDLEAVLEYVPIHFLFNVIVDHHRRIVDAVAGDVIEAHKAGIEKAKQRFVLPVSSTYDVVIVSPGGHPVDTQLYQAVKTLQNAEKITKPGGTILLIARCEEIFGNGLFQYWVETIQDRDKMAKLLKEKFVLGAHKTGQIQSILQKCSVYMYTDIPAAIVELVGFHPIADLQLTLNHLVSSPALKVGIMPYGAFTFPEKF